MSGFLSTYRKMKGVFKRPKFNFFFGLWKNDPNLPMYRNGSIRLAKYKNYYLIRKAVHIEDKSKISYTPNGTPIKSYHILQHNIKPDYAWRRDIRKKLRKWGLGWVPPIITIPWWLKIGVYNWDVMWKWKYNEVRYEFPPQFTIVFFGLCLTITLHEPINNAYTCDDNYWETVLSYFYKYNENISETTNKQGVWYNGKESYFSVRPEYLVRDKDKEEYFKATKKYRENENKPTIV